MDGGYILGKIYIEVWENLLEIFQKLLEIFQDLLGVSEDIVGLGMCLHNNTDDYQLVTVKAFSCEGNENNWGNIWWFREFLVSLQTNNVIMELKCTKVRQLASLATMKNIKFATNLTQI